MAGLVVLQYVTLRIVIFVKKLSTAKFCAMSE